jgi:uridine phosphorylase
MSGRKKIMTDRLTNVKINIDDVPERVIVCGDPKRAQQIASLLEETKLIGQNREYHSFRGIWKGETVAVVSHGVGSPGAAVCFEELIQGGAKKLIRVGTAGSYQAELQPGSLVVSTSSVRRDGLTSQLVPEGVPAVADRHLVDSLVDAAKRIDMELVVKEGMTLTLDAFYSGVLEFPHQLYKKAGVLAVEMECSALFVIAALRGVQAGAILAIDGFADADLLEVYNPHTDTVAKAVEAEALIALDAIIN